MSKDSAAIRDQLGNDPETSFYLNADYYEELGIEEQSTIISKRDITNSFILGDATNGVLGVATGTGGKQVVLGFDDRDITIQRIVNPNNVFHEHFRFDTFQDSAAPNTAYWDTTNFRIAMDSSDNHMQAYNTVITSSSIFLNSQTITKATLSSTETIFGNDMISYFLSADGGSNWEEVTKDVEHTFTHTGTDLRFRVIFLGNGAKDTYISEIQISYMAS